MSVVVSSRGIRGNNRPSQNRKCDSSQQYIAEHLHSRKPLATRPPNHLGGSGGEHSLTLPMRFKDKKMQLEAKVFPL
jgi:hypothetical protein